MRRFVFPVGFTRRGGRAASGAASLLALAGSVLEAQRVPGRDLFEFPIGAMAEPPALAQQSGVAFWNPAAAAVPPGQRVRLGIAALATPADQSVSAQLVGVAVQLPNFVTAALSVARAGVGDLVRTESDPQSLGTLNYSSSIYSAIVARRSPAHVVSGLAVRYRTGELDGLRRGAVGLDGGVLVDSLLGRRDVRLAASSFLWRPANQADERATMSLAADARLGGDGAQRETRAGYGFSLTEGGAREHYGVGTARYGPWVGRVGLARATTFSESNWRLRLGVGVYYARYVVGVARESGGEAGLPAIYQFSLSSSIK
ncbi:MAG TPA: hypothetical protein VFJ74_01100 [Gemmatimonadaceae bacterium]|nr:hypothetical protein [Gemmatimonadaceae bacterium]